MKFWHNITTKIYYKYLVPLLCIMAIAMLLGGILIVILVSNSMGKTGADIKVQTEKDLTQDIQFKHNAYTKNSSNQFQAQLDNILEQLTPLTTSKAFKQLNYPSIRKKVDALVSEVPEILEFKVIRSNGYATYTHCNVNLLYSKDLESLCPRVLFSKHEVFKNFFM